MSVPGFSLSYGINSLYFEFIFRRWNLPMARERNVASQMMLVVKNPPTNVGDVRDAGSILESGRPPGEGNGNPLQYSCLGNPMDRGARLTRVHGIAKSWTQLSVWTQRKKWSTRGREKASRGGMTSKLSIPGTWPCSSEEPGEEPVSMAFFAQQMHQLPCTAACPLSHPSFWSTPSICPEDLRIARRACGGAHWGGGAGMCLSVL